MRNVLTGAERKAVESARRHRFALAGAVRVASLLDIIDRLAPPSSIDTSTEPQPEED